MPEWPLHFIIITVCIYISISSRSFHAGPVIAPSPGHSCGGVEIGHPTRRGSPARDPPGYMQPAAGGASH